MANGIIYWVVRSRSGDQLHRAPRGTTYALCNRNMRVQPVRDGAEIRCRPGLFCRKCFGDNPRNFNGRIQCVLICEAA